MSDAQTDLTLIWALAALALGLFGYMIYPALDSRRWKLAMDLSQEGLLWDGLGVFILASFVGLQMLPGVVIAILVHEYGHVLAYRLAGHKAPKFRLAPFGGVAFSSERKHSQAEAAFISLMGPGLSVALVVFGLLLSRLLIGIDPWSAGYALNTVWVVGFLNALNLLPLFPLDGGHALKAVAATAGPKAARGSALVMSLGFAALSALYQRWMLLVFALLGLAAALRPNSDDLAPPMRPATAALAVAAHISIFLVHLVAMFPQVIGLVR